jgi:DNA-binding Lrp family transcriptional regulator
MSNRVTLESSTHDRLDLQIIHALQIRPRAPFARIAEAAGVSEQTVARRYRRMRSEGIVRVVGLVDSWSVGQNDWIVRVQVRPGSSGKLAEALARRDDVSWVTLSAAGSEVVCSLRSRSREQRDELLLQRLPSTAPVLGISAHAVLHRFTGGGPDWTGHGGLLTAEQIALLTAEKPEPPQQAEPPEQAEEKADQPKISLEPEDQPMLDLLARDGRTGHAALATATGWTEGRVARRLETLRQHGIIYFDVDVASRVLGFATAAYLWLTVEPAMLDEIARQLASHAEVPFVAAVTGPFNLLASVIVRDTKELYEYVSTRVGAVPGVRQMEISPELRRVKQAGSLLNGPRLADPAPPPRPGEVR